jgi:hypothetical protein
VSCGFPCRVETDDGPQWKLVDGNASEAAFCDAATAAGVRKRDSVDNVLSPVRPRCLGCDAGATGGDPSLSVEFLNTPAYCDYAGRWYGCNGSNVPTSDEFVVTSELLTLRCPHPATAARMATLIRTVKYAKVAALACKKRCCSCFNAGVVASTGQHWRNCDVCMFRGTRWFRRAMF